MSPTTTTLLVAALFATAALSLIVAAGVANAPSRWFDARVALLLVGTGVGTVALLSLTAVVFDLALPTGTWVELAVVAAAAVPLSVVTVVLALRGRRVDGR